MMRRQGETAGDVFEFFLRNTKLARGLRAYPRWCYDFAEPIRTNISKLLAFLVMIRDAWLR
jgi:hypothetical protein